MNSTSFQGLENQKTLESFWHKEEVQRDSKVFGFQAYYHASEGMLEPKAKKGFFMGYRD